MLFAMSLAYATAETALDKFHADGATTYCKTTRGKAPPVFVALEPASTGSCPVAISMAVSVKNYTELSTVFDVAWNVSINAGRSDDKFPVSAFKNAISFASSVVACRVDSDCATRNDLVSALGIGSEGLPVSLDLDSGSAVALMTYRFQLPPTGDYVIVGDVSVKSQGTDMVENYVFQRVRAKADLSSPPGTVKPADVGDATTPKRTNTPTSITSPTSNATRNGTKHAAIAISVASFVVIGLVIVALIWRRRRGGSGPSANNGGNRRKPESPVPPFRQR